MKDRESPGPTLSFIPANSSAYSCASKETIISRIPTMHIKWVLNWEAFEYPQQFNESRGTVGTVIRTRAQVIKVTAQMSGKTVGNSQSITEGTFLSTSNQRCGRVDFQKFKVSCKSRKIPEVTPGISSFFTELFLSASPKAMASVVRGPHGAVTQAASHSRFCFHDSLVSCCYNGD